MKTGNIIKTFVPSFILLIVFYFLDLSPIPFFRNYLLNFLENLYPGIPLMNKAVEPYSVWWISFLIYFILIFYVFMAKTKINKLLSEGKNEPVVNLIISKYKNLSIIIGLIPLGLGLCFLIASISVGPTLLIGVALPLLLKGVLIFVVSLFQVCIYYDLKLSYIL